MIILKYRMVQIGKLICFQVLEQSSVITSKICEDIKSYIYKHEGYLICITSACKPSFAFESDKNVRLWLNGDDRSRDNDPRYIECKNEEEAIILHDGIITALHLYCIQHYITGKLINHDFAKGEIYI